MPDVWASEWVRGHWREGSGGRGTGRGESRGEPYLACCAVGHTGTAITAQVEVGGAGTFVTTPRGQQAQVAAASVVDSAGVIGHCRRERGGRVRTGPGP